MDISIIIPVCNVEKYLVRCLDSIFDQHFSGSFEVIAVDDGSSDNSLQVLKKYQEKELRLKIIEHGVNKKLSIARATGMIASVGDYIMHVDADDWLLPEALENLFEKCLETDADVVVYNYVREDIDGKRTFFNEIKKQLITTDKLKIQHHFFAAAVNKIVKRVFVKEMISGQLGVNNSEDLLYATEILLKARKICLIPEFYYVYFENKESLTWIIKPEQYLRSQIVVLNQLQKIISNYKADLKFSENVLNYFEKWIYLEMAKIHFWHNKKLATCNVFIEDLHQFPIMTYSRIRSLELSKKNKFVCLLEVIKHSGFRTSMGIIKRSFK